MSGGTARVLHVFATFAAAGPQLRTVALIDALGDGWSHAVVSMDGRLDAKEHLARPADVRVVPAPAARGTLLAVRAFRSLLRGERPDVLCTYNWGAIEAALAARTLGLGPRHLHHEDGFRPDEVAGLKRRRNAFRRLALGRSRALVVVSHGLREVAERRWGVRGERLRLVPNGIRLARFDGLERERARAELGLPADAFVVGYVGHLRPEKNPRRLVAALAAMERRDARALVLGDGPERAALEADVARLGLGERVRLAGFREDTRSSFAAMDVFAITSDTEQMPVALLEAMASRLPVVATDVGDVRAMLPPEQAASVVPARSAEAPAALARALDALAADAGLRARLGRANRARAEERYGFEAMLAAYRALYEAARAG